MDIYINYTKLTKLETEYVRYFRYCERHQTTAFGWNVVHKKLRSSAVVVRQQVSPPTSFRTPCAGPARLLEGISCYEDDYGSFAALWRGIPSPAIAQASAVARNDVRGGGAEEVAWDKAFFEKSRKSLAHTHSLP